jgi:DNA ligase-1
MQNLNPDTMEYQLFKLSKMGKILSFHILVTIDGDVNPVIVTTKGFIDGAKQQDFKPFTEGKNLGRANQTSALEQAEAEAESQYKKLLDKGYKKWPGPVVQKNPTSLRNWLDTMGAGTDATGKLKPMLAYKTIAPIMFPCLGNFKYDGVRCFSFIEDGGIEKVSRNGKPFTHLDHLDKYLSEFFGSMDCIVDGELYSHTMSFQGIISSVKRAQKSNLEIGYRIYDVIPMGDLTMPQYQRWDLLKQVKKKIKAMKEDGYKIIIEIAPYFRIEDMDDVKDLFSQAIVKGYEGAIFRNINAPYHFGHRSRNLMKYKEFLEEEFEIIGAEEATGRDAGTAVFKLLTNTKPRQEFRARPMGTREEREDYLININQYIGEMGTVKFQEYTDDGIPRFPIFKAIRNYE